MSNFNLMRECIGAVLRTARTQEGKTLRDLSTESGVSIAHLSEIERGIKEVSSELLDDVLRALGLTLIDVFDMLAEQHRTRELAIQKAWIEKRDRAVKLAKARGQKVPAEFTEGYKISA